MPLHPGVYSYREKETCRNRTLRSLGVLMAGDGHGMGEAAGELDVGSTNNNKGLRLSAVYRSARSGRMRT